MRAATFPNTFYVGTTPHVDSREVAGDFGIDHGGLLRDIEETRVEFPTEAHHYRNRLSIVDGAEVPSVALSYTGFALLDLSSPHGANLSVLVGYIRALSAAHKEATR